MAPPIYKDKPNNYVTKQFESLLNTFGIAESKCDCRLCKNMCKHVPCIPTPEEVIAIQEADLLDKMAYTNVVGVEIGQRANVIMPREVPDITSPTGHRCIFLNENDLCDLHDKGLKPLEGRYAHCGQSEKQYKTMRFVVLQSWQTKLGQKLLNFKKELYGNTKRTDGTE